MSILNNNINEQPSAKNTADKLVAQTRNSYQQMVAVFNFGTQMFWNNKFGFSPQEIANELGTNAKEVFELHYKLGQLLASIKPEDIAESLSLIGQFTMNDDGTVTINT